VAGPRSGLTVEISDDQLDGADEPTTHEGDPPEDVSDMATRTVPAGSETAPRPSFVPAPTPTRRKLPALVGIAVASVGMALGFGWAWLHEPAASSAAQVAVVEPEPVVVAEPALTPEPAPVPAPAPETDLALEADPAPPTSERPRTTSKAGPPARVEFAAHEFFFVWIKVAGRTHALEPTAKLSLPPGRHKVSIREREDQPWKTAGTISVAAGRSYKVSLRKPNALALQSVD
jgi:hypothetical protein